MAGSGCNNWSERVPHSGTVVVKATGAATSPQGKSIVHTGTDLRGPSGGGKSSR